MALLPSFDFALRVSKFPLKIKKDFAGAIHSLGI